MPDHDTVLELYGRGISAHDLRSPYVEDRLEDNPFIGLSRDGIERARGDVLVAAGWFPEDTEQEFWQLDCAREALEDAESKAIEALSSGQIIGLGFTGPHEGSPEVVPWQQWHFLNLDFEKGMATGTDLHYAGLRFLRKGDLTDDQIQAIKARKDHPQVQQSPVNEIGPLPNLFATDWNQVTIRLLKDFFVAVRIQDEEQRLSLGTLGLLNRTTGQPNKSYGVLLLIANNQRVSTEKKHIVSDLRQLLQELFGLTSDPFHLEKGRGYVPNFRLVNDRDAAARRAEEKAVHLSFVDERYDEEHTSDGLVRQEPIDY